MRVFADIVGFEWDDGNRDKSLKKHGVTDTEAEEVFADTGRVIREDVEHSQTEARHYLIGKTEKGRILFVSFTIRRNLLRIISARPVNRKEINLYEQH